MVTVMLHAHLGDGEDTQATAVASEPFRRYLGKSSEIIRSAVKGMLTDVDFARLLLHDRHPDRAVGDGSRRGGLLPRPADRSRWVGTNRGHDVGPISLSG
jgi:hypothetical protein